jgi:hypothetical protein
MHKLYKKNSVEYEGKISCGVNFYNSELKQTTMFGKRFKALWEHIISTIDKNPSIYYIKEQTLNKKEDEIYMVVQREKFLVSKELEIYAYTYSESDSSKKEDENVKSKDKTHIIIVELYSYKSNIETIKMFVESITVKYLKKLEDLRKEKHFIYSLANVKYSEGRKPSLKAPANSTIFFLKTNKRFWIRLIFSSIAKSGILTRAFLIHWESGCTDLPEPAKPLLSRHWQITLDATLL